MMFCRRVYAWMMLISIVAMHAFSWQDDIDLNLRNPLSQFSESTGWGFFRRADSEVRLGRYLSSSQHHSWRGGALGDIALITHNDDVVWQMGLNMETLADDDNEINFRLIVIHAYVSACLSIVRA